MVDGAPLIVTARPRTAGSPPYRASHAFLLNNATGAAPTASSDSRKPRPMNRLDAQQREGAGGA